MNPRTKAYIFIALIIIVWASILIPRLPLLIVAFISDKIEKKGRVDGWFGSLFYATDILTNVYMGGYKRTTISAELGNLKLKGSKGGAIAANFVDSVWYRVFKEVNHCASVMESEDKYYFKPGKALIGIATYLATYYFIVVGTTAVLFHNIYF